MDNEDIIYSIFKYRNINDIILNSSISKNILDICNSLIFDKLNIMYFFKRFKKRTFFTIKRKLKTYYTLKNSFINKEEQPIIIF
tara:strand:- start:1037 stop:1288 length:252 start_codon:yes stop_codon:yes gene_type:complete